MPIPHLRIKQQEEYREAVSTPEEQRTFPSAAPAVVPAAVRPPAGPKPVRVPKKRRSLFGMLFLVFLVIFLAYGATGALAAGFATAAKSDLDGAKTAIEAFDLPKANAALGAAERNLILADGALLPWKLLRPVPWIGEQVSAVSHLFAAGIDTVGALRRALVLAQEIFALAGGIEKIAGGIAPEKLVSPTETLATLGREEKRAILEKLLSSGDRLRDVSDKIAHADWELAQIPDTGVQDALKAQVDAIRPRLAQITEVLRTLAPLTQAFPRIAGYPAPKTYLVFLANNTELRPSAGFFGSYGLLKMADGDIASLELQDIYNIDLPVTDKVTRLPPAPIGKYLGVPHWFLRDANWSPDFVESARMATTIYQEEADLLLLPKERISGVIVITPEIAIDLMRMIGPVTVEGVTFTPENLVDLLEYEVEVAFIQKGLPPSDRKRIMGPLMREVVARLSSLPAARWPEALRIVQKHLLAKDVLIYDEDPAVQEVLEQHGWAGRVGDGEDDFLLTVDANLAALKTDAVMEKEHRYAVETAPDGSLTATASVTYRNTGRFTTFTTRYRTYTRFYVPEGSTFISAEGQLAGDKLTNPKRLPGAVDQSTELGKTVFGMFTSIEPGETRTLSVRYRLPDRVADAVRAGQYALRVEKQSGARTWPLTLDIGFGKTVQRATPAEERDAWGDGRYRVRMELSQDRAFEIGF